MSSSSVKPQYVDLELTQYYDFMVLGFYRRYLNKPTLKTYNEFRSYVREYYEQSPVDCLKLSDRYQDLIFKVVFWHALVDPYDVIDFTNITQGYPEVLKWISQWIRKAFLSCHLSEESKLVAELEIISQMIKLAERTVSEMKFLRMNEDSFSEFCNLLVIWKFLIKKISIDLDNKAINYYSVVRTVNEINSIVKSDSSSYVFPSLHLSKRYALLWFYLRYIFENEYTLISDSYHKEVIINLILKFWERFTGFGDYTTREFYPIRLRPLFKNTHKSGLLHLGDIGKHLIRYRHLEYIVKLLMRFHPANNISYVSKNAHFVVYKLGYECISVPRKISSFSELSKYLADKKIYTAVTWGIRVFAELEAYLAQHGKKVDYSTFIDRKFIVRNKEKRYERYGIL